jgi:uncharacterized protein (TIGR04255 family)
VAKRYRNSPIAEALCVLRFDKELWDLTLPGRFYDAVKGKFPTREDDTAVEFQLIPQEQNVKRLETPRAVFRSADALSVVQFGPGATTLSRLKPYQSWNEFRELIAFCSGKLTGLLEEKKKPLAYRVELRYINAIPVKWPGTQISAYLNVSPKTPELISTNISGYYLHLEYLTYADIGALVVDSGSAVAAEPGKLNLMLDLRLVAPKGRLVGASEIGAWMDKAHTEIEKAFEQCITDESRKLFGPVDE